MMGKPISALVVLLGSLSLVAMGADGDHGSVLSAYIADSKDGRASELSHTQMELEYHLGQLRFARSNGAIEAIPRIERDIADTQRRLAKLKNEKIPHYALMPLRVVDGNIGRFWGDMTAYAITEEGVFLDWNAMRPVFIREGKGASATTRASLRSSQNLLLLKDAKGWKVGQSRHLPDAVYRVTGSVTHDGERVYQIEPVPDEELKAAP